MHFFRVRFEVFCRVMAGESEIDQIRLASAILSISQENVGAFQVSMDICAFVDVFVYVQLERTDGF